MARSKLSSDRSTAFTRIEAGGFYEIQWQPGPPSFSLTTDENLLSHIETRMNGSVLKIETHGQIAPTHGVTVVITSPSLTGAELSGALKLEAAQLSGDRFALDTSGATRVSPRRPRQSAHCESDWRQQTQCGDLPGRRRRDLRHRRGKADVTATQFAPGGDHRSGPGELRRKSKIG